MANALVMPDKLEDWIIVLVTVVVTILVAIVLQVVARRILRVLADNGHLTRMMATRLRATTRILLGLVVMTAILQQTGLFRDAWTIVSALVVAMAVGFVALWSVMSNIVCALMILAFRPFQMGDEIEIFEPADTKPGLRGKVNELTLMFTTIEEGEDEDGCSIITRVPNSAFFLKAVRIRIPSGRTATGTFFGIPGSPL